jgi:hypothetical protein
VRVDEGDNFALVLARCAWMPPDWYGRDFGRNYVEHLNAIEQVQGRILPAETLLNVMGVSRGGVREFLTTLELNKNGERLASGYLNFKPRSNTQARARQLHFGWMLASCSHMILGCALTASHSSYSSVLPLALLAVWLISEVSTGNGCFLKFRTPELVRDGFAPILR